MIADSQSAVGDIGLFPIFGNYYSMIHAENTYTYKYAYTCIPTYHTWYTHICEHAIALSLSPLSPFLRTSTRIFAACTVSPSNGRGSGSLPSPFRLPTSLNMARSLATRLVVGYPLP